MRRSSARSVRGNQRSQSPSTACGTALMQAGALSPPSAQARGSRVVGRIMLAHRPFGEPTFIPWLPHGFLSAAGAAADSCRLDVYSLRPHRLPAPGDTAGHPLVRRGHERDRRATGVLTSPTQDSPGRCDNTTRGLGENLVPADSHRRHRAYRRFWRFRHSPPLAQLRPSVTTTGDTPCPRGRRPSEGPLHLFR